MGAVRVALMLPLERFSRPGSPWALPLFVNFRRCFGILPQGGLPEQIK